MLIWLIIILLMVAECAVLAHKREYHNQNIWMLLNSLFYSFSFTDFKIRWEYKIM